MTPHVIFYPILPKIDCHLPLLNQHGTPNAYRMDAIAQIQGLQDIITSKLPPNSLPIIGKTSSSWEKPAKEVSVDLLQAKILAFQECVSAWMSFRQPDSFWGKVTGRIWTHEFYYDQGPESPGWYQLTNGIPLKSARLLAEFIHKNKKGRVKKFLELKKQFLREVEIEKWKLSNPLLPNRLREQGGLPPEHPVSIIHQNGSQLFDLRIKIEEAKHDILALLQFLYPEEMVDAGKKLADFSYSVAISSMIKYLLKIIIHLPVKNRQQCQFRTTLINKLRDN